MTTKKKVASKKMKVKRKTPVVNQPISALHDYSVGLNDYSANGSFLMSQENLPLANDQNGAWKTSLTKSCDGDCLMTCCCPCCMYGLIEEKLGSGDCLVESFAYFVASSIPLLSEYMVAKQRFKIRKMYGIAKVDKEGCNDCCTASFCTLCALCQHAKQMNYPR